MLTNTRATARRISRILLAVLLLELLPPGAPIHGGTLPGSPGTTVQVHSADPSERVGLRTPTSRTYSTDNGFRVEMYLKPLQYESSPGVFEAIDNTLVDADSASGFRYQNKATGWKARFTDNPGHNQVRIELNAYTLSLNLDEPAGDGQGLHAQSDGNRVHYAAPGAPFSLHYSLGADSLKQTIVLDRYTGKSTWNFGLSSLGLLAQQYGDGQVGLLNRLAFNEEVAVFQSVFAVDAAGARQAGQLQLQQPDASSPLLRSYQLSVSVDPAWLSAPERRYPVTIEPALHFTARQSPHMWSVISKGSDSVWYGRQLEVRGDGQVRSLLRWDLSSIRGLNENVPSSATITLHPSASTTCSGGSSGCTSTLNLQPLAEEWHNRLVTWNRARDRANWSGGTACDETSCPGLVPAPMSVSVPVSTASALPGSIQLDVTSYLQAMLAFYQTNFGFRLSLADNPGSNTDLFLSVEDAAGQPDNQPVLTLNFVRPPALTAPLITSPADGATLQSPLGGGNASVAVATAPTGSPLTGRVMLMLDGNRVDQTQSYGGSLFTLHFDPSHFMGGQHRLTARFMDLAGHYADSAPVPITIAGGRIAAASAAIVTLVGPNTYRVNWAAALATGGAWNAFHYYLHRATTASGPFVNVSAAGYDGTEAIDSAPAGEVPYYRVLAISTVDGNTAVTPPATVSPSAPPSGSTAAPRAPSMATAATTTAPSAPTGVQVFSDRNGTLSVVWSAVQGYTYNLYRSTDRSTWTQIAGGLSTWLYNDDVSSVANWQGATFSYEVQAVAAGTPGPQSALAGAMAVTGRRLGVDQRWPYTSLPTGDGTASINLHNGNLVLSATDAVVQSPGLPMVVRRTYNSQGVPSGSFGNNWRLNADWKVEDFSTATAGYAVLTTGDGTEYVFSHDSSGYHPEVLTYWTLTQASGLFSLTTPDRKAYSFDASGRLTSISDRYHNQITFNRDAGYGDRLTGMVDSAGRTVQFSYDTSARLTSMTDPANRTTTYTYDVSGHLATVADNAQETTTYAYDANGRLQKATDAAGRWVSFAYDDTARLSSFQNALGNTTNLAYATSYSASSGGSGQVTITDPLTNKTVVSYEQHGLVTAYTDAANNTWTHTYVINSNGSSQETVSSPAPNTPASAQGLTTTVQRDASGNVTQSTDTGPNLVTSATSDTVQTTWGYVSGSSDLTQQADALGNATNLTWTTNNLLTTTAVAMGSSPALTTQYYYNTTTSGHIQLSNVCDPNNNRTLYGYDSQGNVTGITYVMTATGSNANCTLNTPGKQLVRTMTYNSDGSLQSISELHDSAATSPPKTQMTYDAVGRRTAVSYPDGSTEQWTYDSSGRVSSYTNRGGQSITYARDLAGQLTTATDNAGNATSYTYDAGGNTTAVTDANQHVTSLQYDALHRLTQAQEANGYTSQYGYDALGNRVAVKQGSGSTAYVTSATYYLENLLQSVGEPLPGSAIYSGGSTGQISATRSWSYTKVGLVTKESDANGNSPTQYTYDNAYRLTQVTDPTGGYAQYQYDNNGNRTGLYDPQHPLASGQGVQYTYDALNRVASMINVFNDGNHVTTYAYSDAGDLTQKTEPRYAYTMASQQNLTTSYTYDLGHRVTQVSYQALTGMGPGTVSFTYDTGGRRVTRTDGTGTTNYGYDLLGRLTSAVGPQEHLQYAYDKVSNRTSAAFTWGTVNYGYDAGNWLTTASDTAANNTAAYSYDYTYGHLTKVSLPNQVTRTYSYYTLPNSTVATNRMNTIDNEYGTHGHYWTSTYQYDYNANVRQMQITSDHPNSPDGSRYYLNYNVVASYDPLNRVTQFADGSVQNSSTHTAFYGYDAAGNQTQWGNYNNNVLPNFSTPGGLSVVNQYASYNAANQMTFEYTALPNNWQQVQPLSSSTANIAYEPNGNSRNSTFYYVSGAQAAHSYTTFDDADQLVHYYLSKDDQYNDSWSDDETYAYDGDGRRTSWTSNVTMYGKSSSVSRTYQYDGTQQVVEKDPVSGQSIYYVRGLGGEPLYALYASSTGSITNAGAFFTDHLGSVRTLVDKNGTATNWYDYDAFGQVVNQNNGVSGATPLGNSRLFTGAQLDANNFQNTSAPSGFVATSSFYNLQSRLYNPAAARFISRDTYAGNPWQPATLNLYSYGNDNPVNMVDPNGHVALVDDVLMAGVALLLLLGYYGVQGVVKLARDPHLHSHPTPVRAPTTTPTFPTRQGSEYFPTLPADYTPPSVMGTPSATPIGDTTTVSPADQPVGPTAAAGPSGAATGPIGATVVLAQGGDSVTVLHKDIAQHDVELHMVPPCQSYPGDVHLHLDRGMKGAEHSKWDEENGCFKPRIPDDIFRKIAPYLWKALFQLRTLRGG